MFELFFVSVAVLGPLFYFLFIGYTIFEIPRISVVIYVAALIVGHFYWPPLVLITLGIAWLIAMTTWSWMMWKIFTKKD